MKCIMYLIVLFLDFIFVNALVREECVHPIFSIQHSLQFQRLIEFVGSPSSVFRQYDFQPNETMMIYLLVTTTELSETRSTSCQEEFLRDLPLRPAHATTGSSNLTLFDILWKNASDFLEPTKDIKLMAESIGDVRITKLATITYEGRYSDDMVIEGFAKFQRADFSYELEKPAFVLRLKQPLLHYEYKREVTESGRIFTPVIKESLKFNAIDFKLVGSFPENTGIPRQLLSQKLAESWLLPIARRVKDHIVKPRVLGQSKAFFQPYKNALLRKIGNEILNILVEPRLGTLVDEFFKNGTDEAKEPQRFGEFVFKNFEQFRKDFVVQSASWLFRQGPCPLDDSYMHSISFFYDIRQRSPDYYRPCPSDSPF